ncbi:hypothetical protein J5N97_011988 [Dioscorea zingiberensis]|uniref:Uncharacterized protein n=1 Tax=Dioscorea zingiberensis TaxID=325984 RepID=A0A9D5CNV9_9LILI|nr:hypothetical protein J5N97_011988 [Dioscorea zingiberensis]
MMFSKMFGRFLGCSSSSSSSSSSSKDTGRKKKEQVPIEAWLAGNGLTFGQLFCKVLWVFGVGGSALNYCLTLLPPHIEAGLFRDCDLFEHRQTPESFKYLLNNHPSPDITEAFVITVLGHLGFRHLATSNYNGHTSTRLSLSARFFALMLAKNCFTRDLVSKYQSIDWAAGIPPPPEFWPELVSGMPADGQWRQPLADWIKRFADIVHSRVFPDEEDQASVVADQERKHEELEPQVDESALASILEVPADEALKEEDGGESEAKRQRVDGNAGETGSNEEGGGRGQRGLPDKEQVGYTSLLDKVGALIGKSSETIKDLQINYGAKNQQLGKIKNLHL